MGLSLGLALSACASVEPGRSVGRELDDQNASLSIKSAMLRAEDHRLIGVDVEVTEGVALLTGQVEDASARIYAECLAWSAPSVRQVANEIGIGDEIDSTSNRTRDAWMSQKVRARLLADRDVRSVNYNVETRNGTVYLLGYARTSAERDRAQAQALSVDGVDDVIVYVRTGDENTAEPLRGARRAQMCTSSPEATTSAP